MDTGRTCYAVPQSEVVKEGWRKILTDHGEVYWKPDHTPDLTPVRDGSSQWDFLPPEMQELILKEKEKMEIEDTIQKRLDMGWDKIHSQMDQLPLCRVHGTVSFISFLDTVVSSY